MSALTFEQRRSLRQLVGAAMRARYRRELRMNLWGDDRPIQKRQLGPLPGSAEPHTEPPTEPPSVVGVVNDPVPAVSPDWFRRNPKVVPEWFPMVVPSSKYLSTKNFSKAGRQAVARAHARERPDTSASGLPACRIERGHS